ncbi:hypothetical protein LSH36_5g15063 [Paralvinella palmiformis]|uniref:Uncharacterized protein n=1 Tax=Paralvinella palmiformis TaxID=53620 RepID=A0AAD9KF92_9ANNE|nr:hypothetical protein LSH36_5g15063 [Paralvinella palmiformis]
MVVFRGDPCGIICVLITYGAVVYADYVVVRQLVLPTMSATLWGAFNIVAFNLVVFLMLVAHVRAVFSDPGIVPLPKTSLDFSDIHSGKKMDKFLFYVGVSSLYAVSLVILAWILDPKGKSAESQHARIMHSIILTVESVLFGLFVIAIGCDQVRVLPSSRSPVYNWLWPFSTTHVLPDPLDDYTV